MQHLSSNVALKAQNLSSHSCGWHTMVGYLQVEKRRRLDAEAAEGGMRTSKLAEFVVTPNPVVSLEYFRIPSLYVSFIYIYIYIYIYT